MDEIHIDRIDVRVGDTRFREDVHKGLPDLNINRLAQSNTFTTINMNQHWYHTTIEFSGTFYIWVGGVQGIDFANLYENDGYHVYLGFKIEIAQGGLVDVDIFTP